MEIRCGDQVAVIKELNGFDEHGPDYYLVKFVDQSFHWAVGAGCVAILRVDEDRDYVLPANGLGRLPVLNAAIEAADWPSGD